MDATEIDNLLGSLEARQKLGVSLGVGDRQADEKMNATLANKLVAFKERMKEVAKLLGSGDGKVAFYILDHTFGAQVIFHVPIATLDHDEQMKLFGGFVDHGS